MKIPTLNLLLLCVVAGCVWGPRVAKLAPANGPRGDAVSLILRESHPPIRGELYAVDSTDIYLTAPGLGRVPWSRIYSVRAEGAHRTYHTHDRRISPSDLAELAVLSRFPQGLDSTQLAAVLAARHEPALQPIQ